MTSLKNFDKSSQRYSRGLKPMSLNIKEKARLPKELESLSAVFFSIHKIGKCSGDISDVDGSNSRVSSSGQGHEAETCKKEETVVELVFVTVHCSWSDDDGFREFSLDSLLTKGF